MKLSTARESAKTLGHTPAALSRIVAICFLVTAGALLSQGCSSPQNKTPEVQKPPVAEPLELPTPTAIPGAADAVTEPEKAPTANYLIAGLDNYGAPDAIVLAAYDEATKSFKLLSLPRDTRVTVPDYTNPRKLRNAYKGVDRFVKSVENLLGVEIKGYVIVNIPSAEKIVDSMGGVTIDVEKRLKYVDRAQSLLIDIPAGTQSLNGKKAIDYARFRNDSEGDLGRVRRQRILIKAIAAKATSAEILPNLPETVKTLISNPVIKTNINVEDAVNLSRLLTTDNAAGISGLTLPGEAKYIDGSSYIVPDEAEIAKLKSDFFGVAE